MSEIGSPSILCLASHFKGEAFIKSCKNLGCRVILITKEKFSGEEWPWEAIDEQFFMPDLTKQPDILHAVSYLARDRKIDRIIPLDDFDVETAATLREHLRIPGMGDTTARFFRDKLAMRMEAEEYRIRVPGFCAIINYDEIHEFVRTVSPPWVLKPRSQAGAMGIKKVESEHQLWTVLEELGDKASFFLLEQFVPGDIYHVDSIVSEGQIIFAEAHKYNQPPMSVSHEGGVFISRTLPRNSDEVQPLLKLNQQLLEAFGMVRGVNHTEFIRGSRDGHLYFLETAARVGGANISELVEFATGINLWSEWAKIETANFRKETYSLPAFKGEYAGIMICLSRQETPDLSQYNDLEIVWRLQKDHHAGLIVASPDHERIEELLDDYGLRFEQDFVAFVPPLDEAPL